MSKILVFIIHGDEDRSFWLDKNRNTARPLADSNISNMAVYKSKVYFVSAGEDSNLIYSTDINGLNKKLIKTLDNRIIDFYIIEDWIYVLCRNQKSKIETTCKFRCNSMDYQSIARSEYFKGYESKNK